MRTDLGSDGIQHFSSWREVPEEQYASKSALRSRGLTPGPIRATVYQRLSNSNIELYSVLEATPRKSATEKQMAAIEKARMAQIANRTCAGCSSVMRRKRDLSAGLCSYCQYETFLDNTKMQAVQRMSNWINHKEEYAIIDVETNTFGDGAEIIEIAIVDLDEKILFESLVKPIESISQEANDVHGISDEMLEDAPSWSKVWPAAQTHLEGKKLLIYNEEFDRKRIIANCVRYGILIPQLQSECVMKTFARVMKSYSHYHSDFTWISLLNAMHTYDVKAAGAHRAAADCINVVRLIRSVLNTNHGHAE